MIFTGHYGMQQTSLGSSNIGDLKQPTCWTFTISSSFGASPGNLEELKCRGEKKWNTLEPLKVQEPMAAGCSFPTSFHRNPSITQSRSDGLVSLNPKVQGLRDADASHLAGSLNGVDTIKRDGHLFQKFQMVFVDPQKYLFGGCQFTKPVLLPEEQAKMGSYLPWSVHIPFIGRLPLGPWSSKSHDLWVFPNIGVPPNYPKLLVLLMQTVFLVNLGFLHYFTEKMLGPRLAMYLEYPFWYFSFWISVWRKPDSRTTRRFKSCL